ncbi:phasin family protein [Methylobacterium durans]|nr:phasin family protein [Methylobacterium durans]
MSQRSTEQRAAQMIAAGDVNAALQPGIEAWRALAVDLPLRLTAEMMQFASRRLEAQASYLSALSRCGSVTDAVNLQSTFLGQAVSDYKSATATLSQDVRDTLRAKAA